MKILITLIFALISSWFVSATRENIIETNTLEYNWSWRNYSLNYSKDDSDSIKTRKWDFRMRKKTNRKDSHPNADDVIKFEFIFSSNKKCIDKEMDEYNILYSKYLKKLKWLALRDNRSDQLYERVMKRFKEIMDSKKPESKIICQWERFEKIYNPEYTRHWDNLEWENKELESLSIIKRFINLD